MDTKGSPPVSPAIIRTGKDGTKRKQQQQQSSSLTTKRNNTAEGKRQDVGGNKRGNKQLAMVYPPAKVSKSSKAQYDDMDTTNDQIGETSDEDESIGAVDHVNKLLNKIGNDLQKRMKAKRQRLETCFQSVKATPNEILEALSSQTDERKKILESFKAQTKEVVQKVEAVVSLQTQTEEKLSKMILSTQKSFDQIKDALRVSISGLNDAVTKFANETGELEEKHEDESKKQIQKIHQELAILHKKIIADGQQEEAENFRSDLGLF